jgi:hypothetical protein
MIMVPHLRTIFVYGGRGIDKDTIKDSGWYTYSIQENKWESVPLVFLPPCIVRMFPLTCQQRSCRIQSVTGGSIL